MSAENVNGVLTKTDFTLPPVDVREVWRYAGWHGAPDDGEIVLRQTMTDVIETAVPLLTPRVCYIILPDVNSIPGIAETPTLQRHLGGCEKAVLFAATIGAGIDRLMAVWSETKPTAALLLQAFGAERVEALCDVFCAQMRERYGELTQRFSPGYGHWALKNQGQIVTMLDTCRQIGAALNASLLLTPTKTVTAVFGIKPIG